MSKSTPSTPVDPDLVRQLAELLDETGLTEIEIGKEDWHIRVGKQSGPVQAAVSVPAVGPAAAPTPAAPAGGGDEMADHPGAIKSPMVGVVYTQADPESPSFCQVGDTVAAGDTVLLIEAMKVFNPIQAPKAGKITRILISNGEPVEFGEPLIIIE